MIHPVSLVQAGMMILVTVCIQITGKLSTREVEVTLQVLPCSFYRQDLVHGSLFEIVLSCGGTFAPVSYYNGSTLVDFPLCKADAPDDARYCIKNNFNTTAKGMQSFIVPAGVKLKIGTDELYPENITRLYDKCNPNPQPGENGTDPLRPMANESDLTRQLSIAVDVIYALAFSLGVACLVAVVLCATVLFICCRKKRNPQEEQGQPLAPLSSEESGNHDLGRGRDLNRDLGPSLGPLLSDSLSSGQQSSADSLSSGQQVSADSPSASGQQPSADSLSSGQQPSADSPSSGQQPSADSLSSGQQPSADSLSSGQQPSADSLSSGQQPSADSLSSGQQPSADSLSSGQQPSADSPSSGQQPSADSPSSGQQLSGSGQPSDEADRLPLQISQFGEESLLQEAAAAACRGQLHLRNTNQGNGGCVQDHTMKLPSQLPARR